MPPVDRAYGWRPSRPDPRDELYRYAAPPHVVKALPANFNLDDPPVGQAFADLNDQGNLGRCGPTTQSECITYLQCVGGATPVLPSSIFSYYYTREQMGIEEGDAGKYLNVDSGVANRSMLKALNKKGYCDEAVWPDDNSRFTVTPSQAAYNQAEGRAASILYQAVTANPDQIRSAIYELRRPVIFGFPVFESISAADVTGDIPTRQGIFDRIVGGHDVTVYGWRGNKFLIKNHWANWGKPGSRGTIPFNYPGYSDLWVITALGSLPPPPAPTPPVPAPQPPSPVPSPIDIGAIVDSIFDMLIAANSGKPLVVWALRIVKALVKTWLATHPLPFAASNLDIRGIIDMIFADLISRFSTNPYIRLSLQIAQLVVDAWLDAQGA